MKYDLLRPFEQIPYFTIEGFRQSAGMDSPEQTRILLHRWVKAGRILSLKRGVYMTTNFYTLHVKDALFTEAISAIIFPHSYLSLEFVLQRHNILTEVTYPVTCITPKNTRKTVNKIGAFWYRNIRPDLYYGFTAGEYNGIRFFTASLAKALFDYLYLRPIPAEYRSEKIDLAEELRLNLDEIASGERDEFALCVEKSQSRKMTAILNNFRRTVWKR